MKQLTSKLTKTKAKISAFWILHITGWILLFNIYLLLYYRRSLNNPGIILGLFITYVTGCSASLLLRYFYQRINYQARSILSLSLIIITGSIILSIIWYWFDFMCSIPLHGIQKLMEGLTLQYFIGSVYSHLWVIILWSALYFGIKFWNEWTLQKMRAEKADMLAQKARLQMLRYQLNPHFLFNALNSIRALIEEDSKSARAMITELAEFLRYSLVSKNQSDVPLVNELEAMQHYFAIEKKRFEEKLEVAFEIEPQAEDYPVPSFLIHPLVENAIKYGMKTSPMPLKILIKATVDNGVLALKVCNTGTWVPAATNDPSFSTGTGLANIRQRLENAYPNNHRFDIVKNEKSVCVMVEIKKEIRLADEKTF